VFVSLLVSQFQALTWGVLALVGILAYAEAIEVQEPQQASDYFQNDLYYLYFYPHGPHGPHGKCME
jgi:hypothetical protein